MSEIYQERLDELGQLYQGRARALSEALDVAIDSTRFTEEEVKQNLSELSGIADEEGLEGYYIQLLFDKVSKEN